LSKLAILPPRPDTRRLQTTVTGRTLDRITSVRITGQRVYFLIAASGSGTVGVNFGQSTLAC